MQRVSIVRISQIQTQPLLDTSSLTAMGAISRSAKLLEPIPDTLEPWENHRKTIENHRKMVVEW